MSGLRLFLILFFLFLGVSVHTPAHAQTPSYESPTLFQSVWCATKSLFNSANQCVTQPTPSTPPSTPPPITAQPPPQVSPTTPTSTTTHTTNQYTTNPTTIIREVVEERTIETRTEAIDTDDFAKKNFLSKQVDRIFDVISDSVSDLSDRIAAAFTTKTLTVTQDASLTTVSVSGSSALSNVTVSSTSTLSNVTADDITAPLLTTDVLFLSSTTTDLTASRLYNTASDLYWNGSVIAGATIGTWTTNGTDVYRASGNVGIGTDTPDTKLSINGALSLASTTPASTTYSLYNVGGALFWNGTEVGSGSDDQTAAEILAALITVDGASSDLDADLLDGISSATFALDTDVDDLSGVSDASTARTNLGLEVGTDVQAFNSNLTTYAGITPAANTQSFLAAVNYATMRDYLT